MPKQRSKRRNRANDGGGGKSYLQVGRVLEVLDQLKDKPLTTPELASALRVGERTVIRFMGAMSRYGWPVLYHKTNTSEQLLRVMLTIAAVAVRDHRRLHRDAMRVAIQHALHRVDIIQIAQHAAQFLDLVRTHAVQIDVQFPRFG